MNVHIQPYERIFNLVRSLSFVNKVKVCVMVACD